MKKNTLKGKSQERCNICSVVMLLLLLQVRATFDDMKLKEDLLKGIYAYGIGTARI